MMTIFRRNQRDLARAVAKAIGPNAVGKLCNLLVAVDSDERLTDREAQLAQRFFNDLMESPEADTDEFRAAAHGNQNF